MRVSSHYGGEFEGKPDRKLMKDDDQTFRKIKEYLLQRLNSNSLDNGNTTIEISEVEDLFRKHKKSCVLFYSAIRTFYTRRGEHTTEMHEESIKDLDHIRSCWYQLNISVTPKLHVTLSRASHLL